MKKTGKSRKILKSLSVCLAIMLLVFLGACGESQESQIKTQLHSNVSDDKGTDSKLKGSLKVRFLDVGQADSALIQCDGHYMLIDGGTKKDSSLIYSVLKKEKIEKLDIVVGTHAHADHIGGIPGAFNYANADLTLCPVTSYDTKDFADFYRYAKSNGGGIKVPSVGDHYNLGKAGIDILGVNSGREENDTSIVLKITYGKTSFLFTGDAEIQTEEVLIKSGENLSATVLKVSHHGTENATTKAFLKKVKPSYAVISVGKNNTYGHPTEACLGRLDAAKVKIYRTDLNGDISITSDGKDIKIATEKTATKKEILTPGGHGGKNNSGEKEKPKDKQENSNSIANTGKPSDKDGDTSKDVSYVVNTNTGKFHYPTCKSVTQMKEKNKMYSQETREELIDQGYGPCGNCHP